MLVDARSRRSYYNTWSSVNANDGWRLRQRRVYIYVCVLIGLDLIRFVLYTWMGCVAICQLCKIPWIGGFKLVIYNLYLDTGLSYKIINESIRYETKVRLETTNLSYRGSIKHGPNPTRWHLYLKPQSNQLFI